MNSHPFAMMLIAAGAALSAVGCGSLPRHSPRTSTVAAVPQTDSVKRAPASPAPASYATPSHVAPSAAPPVAPSVVPPVAPSAVPPAAPSAVPPAPVPLEQAVSRAGNSMFSEAVATLGIEPREVVIDPLIDANTGAQTIGTAGMGAQLERAIAKNYPAWKVRPLTRQSLAAKPLLLIGTLTPINTTPASDTQPDAFRIWLTLIDLRTGKVVAKKLDRATPESVNAIPMAFYRDSPTWHKDKTVSAYIDSCQADTRVGDAAAPAYLARLSAAAVVNEATLAYEQRNTAQANRLYREAAALAEPGDLRVLNGLYLTSWQLGQRAEAERAFDRIVASGLEAKRLPMKLLFEPGRTSFITAADFSVQYAVWLESLADGAAAADGCIRIVGHTSRTGSAALNEALSMRRAQTIEKILTAKKRRLLPRLTSDGVGSREALVGIGTDDFRDALDRRVEFKVVDCA